MLLIRNDSRNRICRYRCDNKTNEVQNAPKTIPRTYYNTTKRQQELIVKTPNYINNETANVQGKEEKKDYNTLRPFQEKKHAEHFREYNQNT